MSWRKGRKPDWAEHDYVQPEDRDPELEQARVAPAPAEPEDKRPFVHIGTALGGAIARAAVVRELEPMVESPIEAILGAELLLREGECNGVIFEPQFVWPPYRVDWAVLEKETRKPIAFIECDGREFHSSEVQRGRDQTRDKATRAAGIEVVRFTGSEINGDVGACVTQIFRMISWQKRSRA